MTGGRAGVFDEDLSDFAPKPADTAGIRPEEVRAIAESSAFRSREPQPAPTTRREPRRYRTGRNVQLNLKVRREAADAFYALADQTDMVLGEVFERAVEALQRELLKGKLPDS